MSGFDASFDDSFDSDSANPVPAPQPGDLNYRDHAAEMLDRLPEQFKRKTDDPNNSEKLLIATAGEFQAFEKAYQQVKTQRTIDNAIGQQLDDLGALVGEPRNGLDDDTYRRRVRARITVHRSKGTLEDVVTVTKLIVSDGAAAIRVEPQRFATVVVHVENVAVSNTIADTALFSFLQRTVAACMRIILHSGTTAPATWFRLDSGPGLDAGFFTDSRG
jgi:hypothetical protein